MASLTDKKTTGLVFNIQKYSVHDGPGIRTIIFLKGCNLRCNWCSNPESQLLNKQLAYNPQKCLTVDECKHCIDICPRDAISVGDDRKIVVDFTNCDNCLKCAEACPANALNIYGYEISVEQALNTVEQDDIFYSRSGGGLTLSGGEPLNQPQFAIALLREAHRRRLNTCIETCGNVSWDVLKEASEHLDSMYFDVKSMNSDLHAQATGVGNEQILSNLQKLKDNFPDLPVTVRTPVIPGFNDDPESIQAIADFVKNMPNVKYELLAYHRMGTPKYAYIGRSYPLENVADLPDERIETLRELAKAQIVTENTTST